METLNSIPKRGIWSDSTTIIDQNFKIFEEKFNRVENDSQKCKGLFPSLSSLQAEYPTSSIGSWAYIGSRLPAPVYVYKENEGWVSTGKSGGGNFDPSILANSVAITNIEDLYSVKDEWIFGYNSGNWQSITDNLELGVNAEATSYTFRLSSLSYGDSGELLERSTTDAYLYEFKYGSFVSLNLTSSDGVSKDYASDTLSWTIDDTFYKRTFNGNEENRLPIAGDTLKATLKFKSPGEDDTKVKGLLFKFVA